MKKIIEITVNGNSKEIIVDIINGVEHLINNCGGGAMLTPVETANDVEKDCAIGPNNIPAGWDYLSEFRNENVNENAGSVTAADAGIDCTTEEDHQSYFYAAVEFLNQRTAEEFFELVSYARVHGNKFPSYVAELRDVINADDCYCTAVVDLLKPFGEEYEDKMVHIILNDNVPVRKRIAALKAAKAVHKVLS